MSFRVTASSTRVGYQGWRNVLDSIVARVPFPPPRLSYTPLGFSGYHGVFNQIAILCSPESV